MKKLYSYILTILFLGILIIPIFAQWLKWFPADTKEENRKIAEAPKFDISHLDNFPEQFDAWYNDHFGFRTLGLNAYNNFNYFLLKKSPAPQKAILGKDGWLFQGRDVDIYRGTKRLSNDELKQLEDAFNQRWEFLHKHDCRFIYVVVPTKKIIYPEFMPDEYFRYSQRSMTDQVVEMLRTKTKVEVIDLRPVILEAKKDHPVLYHKMDNHWNDIATYYAYKTIIDHLAETMPIGKTHDYSDFKLDTTTYYGGSIARMLGVQDEMIDYRLKFIPQFETSVKQLPQKYQSPERFPYPGSYERRYETADKDRPRLMMINDSFGEYFYRFLPEHFSYSLFLFDGWEFKLHAQKVLDEKPDVFIMETFEGFVPNILNNLYREENQIPEDIQPEVDKK